MIATFFPLKKLRRNTRYLLFLAILLAGLAAVYHEMVASKAWSSDISLTSDSSSWGRAMADGGAGASAWKKRAVRRGQPLNSVEDSTAWRFAYTPQTWKPEYKGQANLHVFEDWCGSSAADLRRNMHYPLYPHSRTTVRKLAVSPQWTSYGLRIFGYLHPYADGEFVFALSSDDNSEFWLSTDESPLNVQMVAYVGETGAEWTAPGEFNKYSSQSSKPVRLSMQRRYFFEVVHKQNDRGTDHVEVAWQLLYQDVRFMVIGSEHISLYVNESSVLLTDVGHIPQTAASHSQQAAKQQSPSADLHREDRRDSLYRVPLIESSSLRGVLPDCVYKPTYTIKDFPLQRYQGLQFVHMSYIYPNDFTRLTHMENENSCFYPENPSYMKMFGFSRYMTLDRPESQGKAKSHRDFGFHERKSMREDDDAHQDHQKEKDIRPELKAVAHLPDYGDDYDDYVQRRRRRLFSMVTDVPNSTRKKTSSSSRGWQDRQRESRSVTGNISQPRPESHRPEESAVPLTSNHLLHLQQNHSVRAHGVGGQVKRIQPVKPKRRLGQARRAKVRAAEGAGQPKPGIAVGNQQLRAREAEEQPGPKRLHIQRAQKTMETQQKLKHLKFEAEKEKEQIDASKRGHPGERFPQRDMDARNHLREKEIEMNIPLQQDVENNIPNPVRTAKEKNEKAWSEPKDEELPAWASEEDNREVNVRANRKRGRESAWDPGDGFEGTEDEDPTPPPVFDTDVNWSQTFRVNRLNLQALRSDWIDLRCNISGNLLLEANDAVPVVKAFVERLNEKHQWQFTLARVVNVVKRLDGFQGSRYLLELELKDAHGQLLRLSHYIYALNHRSRHRGKDLGLRPAKPQLVLCNPVGFRWDPAATVHFIVPVKNQARWVRQLITDMEQLFQITGDINFNLIITDYNSTDLDVRKALEKSSLPRYEYVNLSGNFERSAGLQAGIDLINDDHSIVFLCDLHIHFPPSIIDTIRKHCVEGYMAFAPVVLRLDCGATPSEAKGYWEVNGFGLLGIYKSDLDRVGGMNTQDFTDRWGGEDWELLDRILQAGLEVERIYLRNFFHHYHSKRGMWNRRMMPKRT